MRWAAAFLGAYGLVVLANATTSQVLNDWEAVAEYPRALIRVFGVAVVTWGLWQRTRWAWWFAVALALLWIVSGGFAMAMFLSVRTPGADALLPPGFYWLFGLTTTLLTVAVTLLCLPRSRAAFRARGR